MNMGYQTAWQDTKRWLNNSLRYLQLQMEVHSDSYGVSTEEYQRLESKLDGLLVVKRHMEQSEEMYQLNNEGSGDFTMNKNTFIQRILDTCSQGDIGFLIRFTGLSNFDVCTLIERGTLKNVVTDIYEQMPDEVLKEFEKELAGL